MTHVRTSQFDQIRFNPIQRAFLHFIYSWSRSSIDSRAPVIDMNRDSRLPACAHPGAHEPVLCILPPETYQINPSPHDDREDGSQDLTGRQARSRAPLQFKFVYTMTLAVWLAPILWPLLNGTSGLDFLPAIPFDPSPAFLHGDQLELYYWP